MAEAFPIIHPGDPPGSGGPGGPGGGGGGGGAPPGGDGSPVDDPCYVDPNEPPQAQPVECLNDPCDWLAPPVGWMCGDTCQTNDGIIDDINVQVAMHEAWQASYGTDLNPLPHNQRNEAMYIVTVHSSGYEIEEIPPGPNTSSCHFDTPQTSIPSNTVAIIHTHPYSHDDVLEDPRCPAGTYDANTVSVGDQAMMQSIGSQLNVSMFVIDKTNIRVLESSNPTTYSQTFARCGY